MNDEQVLALQIRKLNAELTAKRKKLRQIVDRRLEAAYAQSNQDRIDRIRCKGKLATELLEQKIPILEIAARIGLKWNGLKALLRRYKYLTSCSEKLDIDGSVNQLFLSVRPANVLYNANISHIQQLLNTTDKDFSKVRNCGKRALLEIDIELARHGLKRNK